MKIGEETAGGITYDFRQGPEVMYVQTASTRENYRGLGVNQIGMAEAITAHPDVTEIRSSLQGSNAEAVMFAVHGENVRAYVTLAPGASAPARQELIRFARARVGYKAPDQVVVLPEMPLNATGKIDRVALKKLAEAHLDQGTPH